MSNRDKAARIIAVTSSRCLAFEPEECGACYNNLEKGLYLAKRFADAGLLMPDLPDTKECYGTVMNDWVLVNDDGALQIRYGVDDDPLTTTEARELALCLLAAADYVEKEEE